MAPNAGSAEVKTLSREALALDPQQEIERICATLREQVFTVLRRKGAVVAISGGIDSAICAALCVRALGKENVLGLLLPERHSSQKSLSLGKEVADSLEVETVIKDITPLLEACGCYEEQDSLLKECMPEFGSGWSFKIVLPTLLDRERLPISSVYFQNPTGEVLKRHLSATAYQRLVAATNFKQRCRKMMEYFHADRLHYAVCGTPNRLEYDQGFFVKNGDGSADVKPIAHLFKTQVYQLALVLGIPEAIVSQTPSTDTFPFPQTQEEFFFGLPYSDLDLCLYALDHNISNSAIADATGLKEDQIDRIIRDIESKRRAARYLHSPPLVVQNVLVPSAPVDAVK